MTDDDSPYHTGPRTRPPVHDKPSRGGRSRRAPKAHASPSHAPHATHATTAHKPAAKPAGTGSRRRRRGGAKGAKGAKVAAPAHRTHTSHPTSRGAQMETRAWLLHEYGPVCAYCGEKFAARTMTLDHVAPRRGQTAYDRRDNLVLACRPCNALKRDQSPLAFLLARRSRAVNLVKYGAHLSEGLLELARSLIPGHTLRASEARRAKIDYSKWGPPTDDDDSPYKR